MHCRSRTNNAAMLKHFRQSEDKLKLSSFPFYNFRVQRLKILYLYYSESEYCRPNSKCGIHLVVRTKKGVMLNEGAEF